MEPSNKGSKMTPRVVVEIVFFAIYLILGLAFLLIKQMPFNMPRLAKIAFGLLLLLYSLVRLSRIRKELKAR